MKAARLVVMVVAVGCGSPMSSVDGGSRGAGGGGTSFVPTGGGFSSAGGGSTAGGSTSGGSAAGGASCSAPYTVRTMPPAAPPYSGTVYVDPGLILSSDPTSFRTLTATGQGMRTIYDRRVSAFVTVNAWLFDAQFGSSKHVEVQVNPEFTQNQAQTHATFHARALGRLPAFAFRDIDALWINGGKQLYGGGNRSILVHTEQTDEYEAGGWTEEAMLHESGHTSLDAYHANAARWLEAQRADGVAISTYARDNPTREDVAETLSAWFASKYRPGRMQPADLQKIRDAVPSRLQYFDCLGFTDALLQ